MLCYPSSRELNLSSTPNVIATHLLEQYQDPKLRYYYIDNYKQVLRDSLAQSSRKPTPEQVPSVMS